MPADTLAPVVDTNCSQSESSFSFCRFMLTDCHISIPEKLMLLLKFGTSLANSVYVFGLTDYEVVGHALF